MYKDMTAAQRQAAWQDYREALNIHQDGFAARPVRNGGNYHDRAAQLDMAKCAERCRLIVNVSRKLGDDWVRGL